MLDRLALGGMALGVGLQLQGWWAGGFRAGFFLTLVSVILHVVTTHRTGAEA